MAGTVSRLCSDGSSKRAAKLQLWKFSVKKFVLTGCLNFLKRLCSGRPEGVVTPVLEFFRTAPFSVTL